MKRFREDYFLLILSIFILIIRRHMVFTRPAIWQEDMISVSQIMQKGIIAVLEPTNGYMILIPKLITFLSLSLAKIDYYPFVSTVAATFFDISVLYMLAYCPILLKNRRYLPLFVALIPSAVECFLLPLFTFWFAGLLLFLLPLWSFKEKDTHILLRTSIGLFCGLSNPMVIPIAALVFLRWLKTKRVDELLVFCVVLFCSIVQLYYVSGEVSSFGNQIFPLHTFVRQIILTYFGQYATNFLPKQDLRIAAGCIILFAMLLEYKRIISKDCRFGYFILLLLLLLSVLSVARRLDLKIINDLGAGPRYYFYPYILISWSLLQLMSSSSKYTRYIAISFICLASIKSLSPSYFQGFHEKVSYDKALAKYYKTGDALFPVHTNGVRKNFWHIRLKNNNMNY